MVQKVPINIIYPITVNNIDGNLDARIIPTSIRYIVSRDDTFNKKSIRKRSQGGGIIRLLRKKNL